MTSRSETADQTSTVPEDVVGSHADTAPIHSATDSGHVRPFGVEAAEWRPDAKRGATVTRPARAPGSEGSIPSVERPVAADQSANLTQAAEGKRARTRLSASAEPVPQAVRRFLRPLVGVDPDQVRIHRGELAAEVTYARHADAVTVGRDVFLAPGQGGDDPRGIGLLAHELTHVARDTQPNFIPPAPAEGLPGGTADEEGVATQFEASARLAATTADLRGGATAESTMSRLSLGRAGETSMGGSSLRWSSEAGMSDPAAAEPATLTPAAGAWDGLPAPWEALPAWLTTPAAAQAPASVHGSIRATYGPATEAAVPVHAADTSAVPVRAAVPVHATDTGTVPVHAADIDRDLPSPETQADLAFQQKEDQAGGVEPDLDALARQVYALLRRRMAAERRRFN